MTLDLAKLRAETLALIDGIAPGWKKASNGSQVFLGERGGVASLHGSGGCIKRNSRLIAAAPTLAADTLRLLDEIEQLTGDNAKLAEALHELTAACEAYLRALAEGGHDDH